MTDALVDGMASDVLPLDDRGFLYGDHLFETVAFVRDRAPLWDLHMARLVRDAERLMIPPPRPELLADECVRLVDGLERSVVRITVSRGSGGRAYEPPEKPEPRRILTRRPWPPDIKALRRRGLSVHTSPVRLAAGSAFAGIKHGNRLEQVVAAEHARRAGVDEAVLFDVGGRLVEAIAGNLVLVLDGQPMTPRLSGAGVAGVGLQWLREELGCDVQAKTLDAEDLRRAEGLMVINSVAGIRPTHRLDDRPLSIGEPCRRWQRLWNERFECDD